jgi:hypothetical protein
MPRHWPNPRASVLPGEARALFAAMPAGMRDMRSVAHWQRRIEAGAR